MEEANGCSYSETERVARRLAANMDFEGHGRLAIKRTKGGRFLSELTKEEILALQHMSVQDASRKLGVGTTSFKLRCRELGIKRWPFRDLKRVVTKVARARILEQQVPHMSHNV